MAAAETTTSGTQAPAGNAGFPPFRTETYPAQLFWLAVTFTFLFVVMWRVSAPRIASILAERKARIVGDLSDAERHKKEAEAALSSYQSALAAARGRALSLADDNRKRILAEAERAKTAADADAREAAAIAETRLGAMRTEAKGRVNKAAEDAAIDIVSRLTGDTVSASDAAAAVRSVAGG